MALPTPEYPDATWDGNEQSTAADPGTEDPTLAEGRDYNEAATEIVAVEDDLRAAAAEVSVGNMQLAIAYLRDAIDAFNAHATRHQHGGADEVAQAAPAANAIPKAGSAGTLSSGWMPQATELAKGVAEIATDAQVSAGTDDTTIVTPKKLATWHAGTDVFGQDEQYASNDARVTTTSTTFQARTTLTTPALTGTYLVYWMAQIDQSTTVNETEARLWNATDTAVVAGTEIFQPKTALMRRVVSGFGRVVFSGAAKTFEVQYRATGGTAGIEFARIQLWRAA